MGRKKRRDVTGWRSKNRASAFAILADNKKFLMPAMFFIAVLVTVVIAVKANSFTDAAREGSEINEVQDIDMELNTNPEISELIKKYYEATASGDVETIKSIYRGLIETQELKVSATAEYIEAYEKVEVYTKPGPYEGTYIAYVYNTVKLKDYDKPIPGLETLYICPDEDGKLYINGEAADQEALNYIKATSVQPDVIDLNNRVASEYNEMINADESLAELLTRMRDKLQQDVGEQLAKAGAEEASNEAAEESSEEPAAEEPETETVTIQTIRAKDVVFIRKSDTTEAEALGKTEIGQEFKQLEALGSGWSRIEYNGQDAYVKTEYFDVIGEESVEVNKTSEDTETEENATAQGSTDTNTVTNEDQTASTGKTGKMKVIDNVNLRKGQGVDSAKITLIENGSTVDVKENYSNGWSKVEYNGQTGYIKSEFLGN